MQGKFLLNKVIISEIGNTVSIPSLTKNKLKLTSSPMQHMKIANNMNYYIHRVAFV